MSSRGYFWDIPECLCGNTCKSAGLITSKSNLSMTIRDLNVSPTENDQFNQYGLLEIGISNASHLNKFSSKVCRKIRIGIAYDSSFNLNHFCEAHAQNGSDRNRVTLLVS